MSDPSNTGTNNGEEKDEQERSYPTGIAWASAFLIHPLLFGVAFFYGFVFGYPEIDFMMGYGRREFLIEGGHDRKD